MKVDFYILTGGDENRSMHYACRLIEKAYKHEHRVYIHVDSQSDAARIDELLWTFGQGSFVPHECLTEREPESPVTIGYGERAPSGYDFLLNLSHGIPPFYQQFDRIAEIVADNETIKHTSRQHFRHYREQGISPESHHINV